MHRGSPIEHDLRVAAMLKSVPELNHLDNDHHVPFHVSSNRRTPRLLQYLVLTRGVQNTVSGASAHEHMQEPFTPTTASLRQALLNRIDSSLDGSLPIQINSLMH